MKKSQPGELADFWAKCQIAGAIVGIVLAVIKWLVVGTI